MSNVTAMSLEAMLFRMTFNRVSKDSVYSCRIAWQEGTFIHAVIRKTEGIHLTEKCFALSVSNDYEITAQWIQETFDENGTEDDNERTG